jgi:thioredoxin-like negative regulator of GroEL
MSEVGETFEVKKIDVDEDSVGSQVYGVMSVPTVVLVSTDDGREMSRIVGARTKDMVLDWVKEEVN